MTFTQKGLNPNVTVYTSNNTLQGLYTMRLMGKFTPNTVFMAVSPFKINVLDQCYLNKIGVPKDIPPEIIFVMQDPHANPIILSFS